MVVLLIDRAKKETPISGSLFLFCNASSSQLIRLYHRQERQSHRDTRESVVRSQRRCW